MKPVALPKELDVILSGVTRTRVSKNFHTQKSSLGSLMYYVIQVKTGKEQQMIDDIKKYKNKALDVLTYKPAKTPTPTRSTIKKANGNKVIKRKNLVIERF